MVPVNVRAVIRDAEESGIGTPLEPASREAAGSQLVHPAGVEGKPAERGERSHRARGRGGSRDQDRRHHRRDGGSRPELSRLFQ